MLLVYHSMRCLQGVSLCSGCFIGFSRTNFGPIDHIRSVQGRITFFLRRTAGELGRATEKLPRLGWEMSVARCSRAKIHRRPTAFHSRACVTTLPYRVFIFQPPLSWHDKPCFCRGLSRHMASSRSTFPTPSLAYLDSLFFQQDHVFVVYAVVNYIMLQR